MHRSANNKVLALGGNNGSVALYSAGKDAPSTSLYPNDLPSSFPLPCIKGRGSPTPLNAWKLSQLPVTQHLLLLILLPLPLLAGPGGQ